MYISINLENIAASHINKAINHHSVTIPQDRSFRAKICCSETIDRSVATLIK